MNNQNDSYVQTLQFGKPISNTGSFSWTVDINFTENQYTQELYLIITTDPYIRERKGEEIKVFAQSNVFVAVKTLPVSDLEINYAAFCRTNQLEMEHISPESLSKYKFNCFNCDLKVCCHLRNRLPYESMADIVHCPDNMWSLVPFYQILYLL